MPDHDSEEKRVPEYMLRARRNHPRAFTPWTVEEDQRLGALAEAGAGPEEMSRALGRGLGGIRVRLEVLGLAGGGAPASRRRGAAVLPVPLGDWVPPWRSVSPNPRWVRETARFWGVAAPCLEVALEALDEPELTALSLAYGLPDRCAYTYRAVGECLDLSEVAARRLVARAEDEVLRHLRAAGADLSALDREATLARRPRRPSGPTG